MSILLTVTEKDDYDCRHSQDTGKTILIKGVIKVK